MFVSSLQRHRCLISILRFFSPCRFFLLFDDPGVAFSSTLEVQENISRSAWILSRLEIKKKKKGRTLYRRKAQFSDWSYFPVPRCSFNCFCSVNIGPGGFASRFGQFNSRAASAFGQEAGSSVLGIPPLSLFSVLVYVAEETIFSCCQAVLTSQWKEALGRGCDGDVEIAGSWNRAPRVQIRIRIRRELDGTFEVF